ncbi:MAG: S-layer homology domain-containing protein, partial [Clostridia bacterium]|nr:S-layer homology domain-containing protein [Clostridia bacterium]
MKKIISLILTALMLAGTAAVFVDESPFSDVKTSRWSYEAIQYAVEQGYMNGIGDGKFDPAGSMTRGMVVTVLYRREGSPEVTFRNDFSDVKAGKYYSDAVIWAKDEGVVNGVTETTFEPNGKITREQLATMLSRFSERCPVSVPERADLSGYPDADKIHSYAKDARAWANEANLIKGRSDGTLSPRGEATREQFATILKRFDDTFTLVYNEPVPRTQYTEPEYPLVDNADVYVAVNGSDSNTGTFDAPVATFNRAVELVREIKQTKTTGDIVVAFKAGDYGPLSLNLTAGDSGTPEQRIVYCKYGDGDVVFDNGTTVTEDEFVPLDEADKALFIEKNAGMIKKADAAGRLDDYTLFDLVLSERGEMAVARFPNRYDDGTDHLQQSGYTVDDHHIAVWHALLKNRIGKYHTTDGLYLYGFITLGWYKDLMETDGCEYDEETGNYVFFMPHPENTRGGNLRLEEGFAADYYQMAIVNVSEELDARDEFWFDRSTDTLYVYDPSGDYSFVNGGDMIT